jgi:PIN domain nuclease of toxin-antitoxin system
LAPRFLLDTNVVIRYFLEPRKLSREQARILNEAVRQRETLAVSAITLLEIALVLGETSTRVKTGMQELFQDLSGNPVFALLPLTYEIAIEVALLGAMLRDPADRAIVATARIHRLRLLTSDERIIESKLVGVVD